MSIIFLTSLPVGGFSSEPHQIIAFLNTGSGGGQAESVQTSFVSLLGEEFVYDLNHCSPESVLMEYALDPHVRVLACGGDGTIGWVEGATDEVWGELLDKPLQDSPYRQHLPLAIMPLGTGNDLSRTLGWGSEYKNYMKGPKMLEKVVNADIEQLDRWRCVIVPEVQIDETTKRQIPMMLSERMRKETSLAFLAAPAPKFEPEMPQRSESIFDGVFCNYFGIGIESEIALAFHREREAHPEKFTSPFTNKLVYLKKGFSNLNGPLLRGRVRIVASKGGSEYTELEIPKYCRSIILLNISSYAAGTKLSKAGKHDDKLIEVIFCRGIARLGMARVGAKIQPAATVDSVLIKTTDEVPCQVDGEPWVQPPSMISIRLECQRPVLKPYTKSALSCRSSPA